jgi:hypothetical protein
MLLISKDPRQEYKYSIGPTHGGGGGGIGGRGRLAPTVQMARRKTVSFEAFALEHRAILERIHEECVRNARLFCARDFCLSIDEAGLREGLYRYLYDTFDS